MMTKTISYTAADIHVPLGVDEAGSGRSVVLLPALSSISTRTEMRPLLEQLASCCRVCSVDWPGFGNLPRNRFDNSPRVLSDFLAWFLNQLAAPCSIVAAGHAATYALYQAAHRPGTVDRLVLLAPTWRGPLPTMMGGPRPWFTSVRRWFDRPGLGALLYRLNVSRVVLTAMARGHVYDDPKWLTRERLTQKVAVTRAPGARYSAARFVTGALDRVGNREAFLELARRASVPILVIYGAHTPPKSRAEIEALTQLPNVLSHRVSHGKLSLYEEFPSEVARIVEPFLTEAAR
jgi:pimeloyl-ACP methyl ester carboxylesterase